MMGCKTGMVTCLQECYPEVEEIASKETEIESEREIQSNREGERDSEENRDESDVEIDNESEYEHSEDETFRNVNKFVEIEYEMEYNSNIIQLMCLLISF